jgi:hypothetical protein
MAALEASVAAARSSRTTAAPETMAEAKARPSRRAVPVMASEPQLEPEVEREVAQTRRRKSA